MISCRYLVALKSTRNVVCVSEESIFNMYDDLESSVDPKSEVFETFQQTLNNTVSISHLAYFLRYVCYVCAKLTITER
jgi:hypothetical protein